MLDCADDARALNAAYADGQISRSTWLSELAKLRTERNIQAPEQSSSGEQTADRPEEVRSPVRLCSQSSFSDFSPNPSVTDVSSLQPLDVDVEQLASGPSSSSGVRILKPGMVCQHESKGKVEVHRLGGPQDFFNDGRVYISCEQLKRGCTHKFEKKYLWVTRESLVLPDASPPHSPQSSPTCPERVTLEEDENEEHGARLSDFAEFDVDDPLPARALHERKRKLTEKKLDALKRGRQRLPMKSHKSRTTPEDRISQFPGEPLRVVGNHIRCTVCNRSYKNKWSDIRQHVNTDLHIKAFERAKERQDDDDKLKVTFAPWLLH